MIIPEHLLRNGITEGMFMSARLCGRPLDGITFSQPPMGEPPAAMFAGLDLGQAQDFTALVICERTMKADPAKGMRQEPHLAVRHIHRWQLGTPYPAIVADVKELYANPPLQRTTLAIDRTGVGRAVVDQFVAADIRAAIHPWTITFGQGSVAGHSVAKIELVGAVQTLLGTKRLKIAPSLPL
ncbi:MAG TPA: hypothetical protein VN641_09995, partial [Urbifossiella sp.]|nr:hypothetical protein [Urbifossiella sp.]